jgi:hypothetical protein
MTPSPTIKWVALALVGLVIAAGVAVLGSSLASRQIGLSSEPLRAGDALAPSTIQTPESRPAKPRGPGIPTAPPEPVAPPTEPQAPSGPAEPPGDRHDGEGGDD